MNELWQPSLDGTEEDVARAVVYQAVGAASMCWIERDGERVFHYEMAKWVADGLLAWIEDKERR